VKCVKAGPFYQLRLARGEDIPTEVIAFVTRNRVGSGIITGIGAAEHITLGWFNFKTGRYRKKTLRGEYEIAAIVGNVAWDGRTPICHMHALITGRDMAALGGHLFAARVAATCEIAILPGSKRLARKLDPATGLKLLALR